LREPRIGELRLGWPAGVRTSIFCCDELVLGVPDGVVRRVCRAASDLELVPQVIWLLHSISRRHLGTSGLQG
jgi:hypothetical protein